MVANYSEQEKLVLQMAEKLEAQVQKVQLLEEACRVATHQKE